MFTVDVKQQYNNNPVSKGTSDRCRHLSGIAASRTVSGPMLSQWSLISNKQQGNRQLLIYLIPYGRILLNFFFSFIKFVPPFTACAPQLNTSQNLSLIKGNNTILKIIIMSKKENKSQIIVLNFSEGAYWFGPVRPSVRQHVCP